MEPEFWEPTSFAKSASDKTRIWSCFWTCCSAPPTSQGLDQPEQEAWGSTVIPQKCSWHPCNGRKWRGTKKPLDEGERESKKAGLKLNIQKTKVMASCPITSWQTEGAKVEAVTDFTFLGSKITADGDLSQEIKMLAPWKKSFDKPRQSIKKQRHHFIDKGPYSQSFGFSQPSRL